MYPVMSLRNFCFPGGALTGNAAQSQLHLWTNYGWGYFIHVFYSYILFTFVETGLILKNMVNNIISKEEQIKM